MNTSAVLTGLRLMGDGWPQGLVVAARCRVRPDLERHHARVLKERPATGGEGSIDENGGGPG
jgi:hypothetical protein